MNLDDVARRKGNRNKRGGDDESKLPRKMYVEFEGLRLPKQRSNFNLGSDEAYVKSATAQIETIRDYIPSGCRVLDFGSGQGRLLNGLMHMGLEFGQYVGVDVDQKAISWSINNLAYPARNISFLWYNYKNDRYNADGSEKLNLTVPDNYFDLVFSNSVFTHLNDSDTNQYAGVLFEKVRPGGVLYVTAFVEDDVEPVSENPDDYFPGGSRAGTVLLRVRYEREYFIGKFLEAGFELVSFKYRGVERSQQSEILLRKPAQ